MLYSHASTISHHAMTAMVVSLHLVLDTLPIAIVALSASQPSASPSVRAGTKYVVTVCVFSVIILPELIFCCTFVHQTVIMTPLYPRLLALRDRQYAEFQARLVPGVAPDSIIGIRVPLLRAFAKDFAREADSRRFLSLLPHRYYDENMLHALLLSQLKDMDECVARVEEFLPYVDNWAVCDIMSPKVFGRHPARLMDKAVEWSRSPHAYTCRFGLAMLMTHFLDSRFSPSVLDTAAAVESDEYYVKMMVAWFFATALAKQWDAAIPYLQQRRLGVWVHNKTIQKACESYRITAGQKAVLRTMKITKANDHK